MHHMIYEPECIEVDHGLAGFGTIPEYQRVFAYIQADRKIVVVWQSKKDMFTREDRERGLVLAKEPAWETIDDHVCEDFDHFIAVWKDRWEA